MDTQSLTRIECPFCKKAFASKSTYGRHLDLKRADKLHPAEEVDNLRKNVVRRGENRPQSVDRAIAHKNARLKASRTYNAKEDVRERNKRRRKDRDTSIKASLRASSWYLEKLGKGRLPESRGFVGMVLAYLPPLKWPEFGEFPGETEFQRVLASLGGFLAGEDVFAAWQEWKTEKGDKQHLWQKEAYLALRQALLDTSLHQIVCGRDVVKTKQEELYQEYSESDILGMIISDEE